LHACLIIFTSKLLYSNILNTYRQYNDILCLICKVNQSNNSLNLFIVSPYPYIHICSVIHLNGNTEYFGRMSYKMGTGIFGRGYSILKYTTFCHNLLCQLCYSFCHISLFFSNSLFLHKTIVKFIYITNS
jgi:hypothetical protein